MSNSKARDLASLLSGSGTGTIAPALVSDQDNTSTGHFDVPAGTTGQRPANPNTGYVRFNTTLDQLEQYTADSQWQGISPPPTVTSTDVNNVDTSDTTQTIVITGQNFDTNATAYLVDANGATKSPTTSVRNSGSQITITYSGGDVLTASVAEPLDIVVANGSGLSAVLDDHISIDASPVWQTSSGSLGVLYDTQRSGASFTVSATDPEGESVTYSVTSGALPSGMSLASATGVISGTPNSVLADTTSNFTITANDGTGNTTDRSFSITVKAPVAEAFSYTGSDQSFTVPSGITSVTAYMWGGGGGGSANGFSGGSGGYTTGTINVSSISSLTLIVGGGGENQDPAGNPRNYNQTYGGGGSAGSSSSHARNQGHGAGRSAIRNGSTELATAGGGGGAGYSAAGGAGGGTTGGTGPAYPSPGHSGTVGQGGTQSAGGATGSNGTEYGVNGIQFAGGYAGATESSEAGGGGGGYYGGGPGGDNTGGGGGSGYVGGMVSGTTTQGSAGNNSGTVNPPQTGSSYYSSGVGVGAYGAGNGGHGRIVLVY